jgi:AraC-like DNA-binding protein
MQPDLHFSYRPAPPLDKFVERLWYWEGTPPPHAKDRLIPTGNATLVINLAEDEIRSYSGPGDSIVTIHPGAVIVGACSRYTVIDTREQRAVVGVTFLPGGMTPFFDPAADELTNTHSGLCDVWGTHGATLRERVLTAATPYSRLKVVEAELLRRALRPLRRRAEIDFVIAQLTHRPDRSVKRFERALLYFGSGADWSDLAARCGYFDQSHLIRDCREISGYTPEQLQARRMGVTNHVAME